jgi:hypothetical protein
MKRFVKKEWVIVLALAVLTVAVSAVAHADEDGTILIAVGFLAVWICSQAIVERLHESRAKHGASSTHRRIPR